MRWTDELIDNMNRTDTVNALKISYQVLSDLSSIKSRINSLETEISQVETRTKSIMAGSFKIMAIIGGIILFFIFNSVIKSGIVTIIIVGVLVGIAFSVDKSMFAQNRTARAEEYRNTNLPPLLQQKYKEENYLKQYCSSEMFYNVTLFLPEQYFNEQAIPELISLLQSRRATNLAEAINAYETMMHHQRIEQMQMQQMMAAQAAAQAQQQAAAEQRRAADAQVQTANYLKTATKEQIRASRELTGAARSLSSSAQSMARNNKSSSRGSSGKSDFVPCPHCGMTLLKSADRCPSCGERFGLAATFSIF